IAEGTNALTITGAGNITLSGGVSGTVTAGSNALIKGTSSADTGTLTLTGAANTYTGVTAVNDGVVNIQIPTALGNAANSTTIAGGADLQLQGNIAVANTGAISLAAGATLESVSG